jgi:quercetin dioxygenase-like cupin family protein
MSRKHLLALAAVTAATGGGLAVASHVTPLEPATVPTGFFTVHSSIADVPVWALVHATKNGTEITIQHVRLDPNVATGWHTHPGPGIVAVQKGALTYQDGPRSKCRSTTYEAGSGFVDQGFGHVHRAIAGPEGADFYVVYVHPPGSATHVTAAEAPEACTS